MRHYSFFLAALFFTAKTSAFTPSEASLDALYMKAAEVAAITIVKGEMINVGQVRCGARYTAQVEKSFKGSGKEITFESQNGLEIGLSYLMFFRRTSEPDAITDHHQNPEQLALCPPRVGELTPDLTYGTIKEARAFGSNFDAYEIYGVFIILPNKINTELPKRYDTDQLYGTVLADKNAILEHFQQLEKSNNDDN